MDSTHDEDAILKSPTSSNASKSPEEPALVSQPKKVALKRKLTISMTEPDSTAAVVPVKVPNVESSVSAPIAGATSESTDEGDKKPVKLSALSMQERLELRAKKFGVPLTANAQKQARAERFNVSASNSNSNTAASIKSNPPAINVDALKKRAERFGGSVSTVMSKIEIKEKLEKRQQRFGAAAVNKTEESETKPSIATSTDYADKAKLRLERFKTAVK